jgi:hypothetical protein
LLKDWILTKNTQESDIEIVKKLYQEYKNRKKAAKDKEVSKTQKSTKN